MGCRKKNSPSHDLQRLLFKLAEHVKAFQGLTPAEITDLLGVAEKCTFEPGAYHRFKEGNVGVHMYIIIERRGGRDQVRARRRGGTGAPRPSADSFGEMALADQ
jgi:hypothetical protein